MRGATLTLEGAVRVLGRGFTEEERALPGDP